MRATRATGTRLNGLLGRASCLAVLVSLALPGPATAKSITVNTTKDAAPKVGDCTGSSPCSLRQAVEKAAPGDTVVLPSSSKHYLLALGAINVTKSLTIRGGGPKASVIDGNGGNGVFFKTGGTSASPDSFTIAMVTITGSKATGESFGGHPFSDSGAIVTDGFSSLHLVNCAISGNTATAAATPSSVVGGAIDSEAGAVTISRCSIVNNRIGTSSGNSVGAGGVVSEGGPLTITRSNLSHNSAVMHGAAPIIGGGVVSEGGNLNVSNSTIAGNRANTVQSSSNGGGGVLSDGGATTITNTTVSGNTDTAPGSFASGGVTAEGGLSLVYATVTRNSGHAGANLVSSGGTYAPFGSVLALAPIGQSDCTITSGTIASKGHNFSDQPSCGLNGPGDRTHGNPHLGPLASNGGLGRTEAPLAGSPLIDAIPKASCAPKIKGDERGRPRPDDGESACDIGAYEIQDK